MKRILTVFIIIIFSNIITYSQLPDYFQYQCVVRDGSGSALLNQTVNFQMSIISGSPSGTVEYTETHGTTTNPYGIATLEIGNGTPVTGSFAAISWGTAPHFVKVEADPTGGTTYIDMGTTQLLSVPYALYSEQAGNVLTYSAGTAINISGNVINNTAPDQTVTINSGNGILVTGSYPAFSVENTQPDQAVTLTPGGATAISGTYPNFTISSTDNNTTYTAGSGINVTGTTITNTTPDQTVNLTPGGATTISGTYPNFTISSTDQNTGTPGGSNKTLQFNNNGSFGGDTSLIWDNSNKRLGLGVTNPFGRVVIQGSQTAMADEPLFEIRNRFGQQVMVVYEDSVHFYIADGALFSNKGGFAVSGRNNAKGFTNNYLVVHPDSTRIYLNDDTNNDGFAIKGFNGGNMKDYLNVSVDTTEIINPSQPRILWYPTKESFLTGRVLIEHRDSVGLNSFASGNESKSVGDFSQALGYRSIARGNYSTAIGKNAIANNINSFAFGDGTKAFNQDAYSFGAFAEASGIGSFAFGSVGRDSLGPTGTVTEASGNYSFAFGQGSHSVGEGSIAFGAGDSAKSPFSIAMGYKTKASNWYATSMGYQTNASGEYSTTMSFRTNASGFASIATGRNTNANGFCSTAMGDYSDANGDFSVAIGSNSNADGQWSTALGMLNNAIGTGSTSIGYNSTASGIQSTTIGGSNTATASSSVAIGQFNNAVGTSSLAMGYDTDANGDYSTSMGFRTICNGNYSTAMGGNTISIGIVSTAMGGSTVAYGDYSLSAGKQTRASGNNSSAFGESTTSRSYNSAVFGRFNDTTATSISNWVASDPLFIIGNGSSDLDRTNALTVLKNGETYMPFVYNASVGITNRDLYIDNTGKLGYLSSSRRYKNNISDMDNIGWLFKLRPVNYTYINDKTNKKQFGLIAEEVEEINPLFVSYNNNGSIETVNYSQLISPMLKAIQELKAENELLKNKISEIEEIKAEIENLKKYQTSTN